MEFKVINPFDDEDVWDQLVARLSPNIQDIHLIREYGLVYYHTYQYIPFLVFWGDDDNYIIQSFVKRSLNKLPFMSDFNIEEPFFDISNPYGFGGPFLYGKAEKSNIDMFAEFTRHFSEYCYKEKIATEFTSLHPMKYKHQVGLINNYLSLDYQKEVVYIDLSLSLEFLWKDIRKGHKSSIKKAINSGVQVRKVNATDDNFRILNQLYYHTMQRNNAAERWFFPEDYFRNCYKFLGEKRVSLFFAFLNEIPISVSIFIHDFNCVYYHFAGSDEKYYQYCANNLLLFEVMKWAKQNGFKEFHLGGGVSPNTDDNLFIFKSGFSKLRAPLFSYQVIHNIDVYNYLSELKLKHEQISGKEGDSEYFPIYRR